MQRAVFRYKMSRPKSNPKGVYPFELLSARRKDNGKCGLSSTPWNKKQARAIVCGRDRTRRGLCRERYFTERKQAARENESEVTRKNERFYRSHGL